MTKTTIQIKSSVRDELKKLGDMDDDYNSVIERLIREHNRNRLVDYSKKVVKERKEDFVDINEL